MRTRSVIAGVAALLLIVSCVAASAADIYVVCSSECDPGDPNDGQVGAIPTDNSNVPAGTRITIRDKTLQDGRYYAYAVWKKESGQFFRERVDVMQVAGGDPGDADYVPFSSGGYSSFGWSGSIVRPVVVVGDIFPQ